MADLKSSHLCRVHTTRSMKSCLNPPWSMAESRITRSIQPSQKRSLIPSICTMNFCKQPPSIPTIFAEVLQKEEGHQPVTAESPSLKRSGHPHPTGSKGETGCISKCLGLYSLHIVWSSGSQSAFWLRLMMDNALSAACRKRPYTVLRVTLCFDWRKSARSRILANITFMKPGIN